MYKIKGLIILIVFFCIFTIVSCSSKKEIHIEGKTMGTTYSMKVVTKLLSSKCKLQNLVNHRLSEISSSLSTYDITSEISRFNSITNVEDKFYPSKDFLDILSFSKELYELVGDVWDPSLDPIVNAWGFGREGPKDCPPNSDNLKLLLNRVDFDQAVILCDDLSIKKGFADATIDLASIAKGFGIDQIAKLLLQEGFKNFLVEIGGEVYARGVRQDGQCWIVGINYPMKTSCYNEIFKFLPLSNGAVATSGDYRNFLQIDDEMYSHIIDPRTGAPALNNVVSASVIASNCTLADGLATALMLLDPENSISLVNSLPLTECIVITSELKDKKVLKTYSSKGIKQ